MIVMPTTQNQEAPTPEKMQWRNVKVRAVHSYDGTPPKSWTVTDAIGSHSFPADEWEMSVEFKRKPRPLLVGERVVYYDSQRGVIDAISETSGSREFWVRGDGSQGHATYYENELKREAVDD